MIIALAGSCLSSSGPARKSRERCRAWASDSLSAVALAVVIPHPVFVLMAALTGSLARPLGSLTLDSLPLDSSAPSSPTPSSLALPSPALSWPALSWPVRGMSPAGSGSSRQPALRDDLPAAGEKTAADGETEADEPASPAVL